MESFSSGEEGDGFSPVATNHRKRKATMIDESDSEDDDDDDDSGSEDETKDGEEEKEEDMCPICLGEFVDQLVGVPENCKHVFCNDCLQEWTKNVNNCPVDRKKFNSISVYMAKGGDLLEEIYVEDKVIDDGVIEQPPTFCQVCGSSEREDQLLLCDECDNGYHLDCLIPALNAVPIDEWYCEECQPNNIHQYHAESHVPGLRARQDSDNTEDGLEAFNEAGLKPFNEAGLEAIYERNKGNYADMAARALMFSGTLRRNMPTTSRGGKARTVASSRGRGRGRSTICNSSRATSSGKKSKKRRKSRKGSKKSKKSKKVEKAEQKVIDEQLKKCRERLSQKTGENTGPSLSLFGDPFGLNDFDLNDNEFLIEKEEKRSCIVNTTDVVGSIMDGFGTLNPDDVIVSRDGKVQNKKELERISEQCKKDLQKKESDKIQKINKQRRRIKFIDASDDSDSEQNNLQNDKDKIPNKQKNKDKKFQAPIPTNTLQDLMKAKLLKKRMEDLYLVKQAEKKKAEELENEIKKMRELKSSNDYKTTASLHTISKFKIPKKAKVKKEVEKEKLIKNEEEPHKSSPEDEKVSWKHRASEVQKNSLNRSSNTSTKVSHQREVQPKKVSSISLEKKYKLYKEGKLRSQGKTKTSSDPKQKSSINKSTSDRKDIIMTQRAGSLHSSSATNDRRDMMKTQRGFSLDSNTNRNTFISSKKENSRDKAYILSKSFATGNCPIVSSESPKKPSSKPVHRKTVSFDDYKQKKAQEQKLVQNQIGKEKKNEKNNLNYPSGEDQKQLFEDLFGDPDLDLDLEAGKSNINKDKTISEKQITSSRNNVDIKSHSTTINPVSVNVKIRSPSGKETIFPIPSSSKVSKNNRRETLSKEVKISTTPDHHSENSIGSPFNYFLDELHITGDKTDAKYNPFESHKKARKPFQTPNNNLPIAVVSPSLRQVTVQLKETKKVTDPRKDNALAENSGSRVSSKVQSSSKTAEKVQDDSTNGLVKSKSMSSGSKKTHDKKNASIKKKPVEISAELIDQMKAILKPYYKSQMITKDQWKLLLKRSVEKVKHNPEFYTEVPDRLQNLLKTFIAQLPNDKNRPNWFN